VKSVDVEIRVGRKNRFPFRSIKNIDCRHERIKALPPDYMVWAITNDRDCNFIDLRELIVRWVTPDSPEVTRQLSELGLQTPGKNPFLDMRRIYEHLLKMGFSYDNSKLNFGAAVEHNFQRVRLPDAALRYRRINCIDAVVLLASFIENLGYEPIIGFMPHHAFLALVAEGTFSKGGKLIGIEGTGLCPYWFIGGHSIKFNDQQSGGQTLSFEMAHTVGQYKLEECLYSNTPEPSPADILMSGERKGIAALPAEPGYLPGRLPPYHLVSVSEARNKGIRPLSIFYHIRHP
jgi:hypothetical protein